MFFLIWRGWGIAVPLIAAIAALVASTAASPILARFGAERYLGVATAAGLLGGAALVWKLGRRLNANGVRRLLDPATGREVVVKRLHTLFFVRMEYWAVALIALAGLALIGSLAPAAATEAAAPRVGAFYAIDSGDGTFGLAKVLVVEDDAVHVRLYAASFTERPTTVDPADLTLGTPTDASGFGIGHLPLAPDVFAAWEPSLLRQAEVTEEELDGYRLWQEAGGGIFGSEPGGDR